MYKNIIVPLDGSELAECVLPHLESTVKGCNTPNVTFIRVVEPVHLPIGVLSDGGRVYSEGDAERDRKQADLQNIADAEKYLAKFVGQHRYGANVQIKVLTGKAAESIAEFAEKNSSDLIVMATHGRSGVSRWVWGSTAEKILRSVCIPVLLVRAPGCPSA